MSYRYSDDDDDVMMMMMAIITIVRRYIARGNGCEVL